MILRFLTLRTIDMPVDGSRKGHWQTHGNLMPIVKLQPLDTDTHWPFSQFSAQGEENKNAINKGPFRPG